ncbi:hypothetical protein BLD49_17075 [Erwinia sp. OLMDSP33]|nr:hypothetical protein BV501_18010 [Erwinia sp. OAMSP11]PIJ67726.1 hypothetical protein BK416_16810 [Erwinia sp. OLSSP12]PIJ78586.1 hypothetical protein BLD47_17065 [Erwinia sp. OLCASP19]PIJ79341.1 hypothetical protein BLD46_17230 [Erwinia sp. OLMTSP26]PIJ80601.1 hypothetical protein BLD49_17075 [Erwinia sp. OLMDSP33]PIJ92448.1 hypothetical protein BL249_06260 [Erwinia sp. OLFS4]
MADSRADIGAFRLQFHFMLTSRRSRIIGANLPLTEVISSRITAVAGQASFIATLSNFYQNWLNYVCQRTACLMNGDWQQRIYYVSGPINRRYAHVVQI